MGNGSMVYFFETLDGHCRIGYTEDKARIRAHERDGLTLITIRPGLLTDEKIIHKYFKSDLVGRDASTYKMSDRVTTYIGWLITRGYSCGTYDEALNLDPLPFEVWRPEKMADPFVDSDGKANLITSSYHDLSPRERIRLSHEYVHLSSETDEWYTPLKIIELVRRVFGGTIDFDPASCIQANRIVRAKEICTRRLSGLRSDIHWKGKVWLNPPYGRGEGSAGPFIRKLISEIDNGFVTEAITILNLNSGGSEWFRDTIWQRASIHLVWYGRINFCGPEENISSPSKYSIFSYFGPNTDIFSEVFGPYGKILPN